MTNQDKTGVLRDAEGYLVNPEDWSKTIARELAAEEDIEIDDDYWLALNFMRDYFRRKPRSGYSSCFPTVT